jgi:hypothetical protein
VRVPTPQFPPENLLAECPVPTQEQKDAVKTNEDLAYLFIDTEETLKRCDADKTSLREWVVETKKNFEGEEK